MKWDYSTIKQQAKANGLRVKDYLALAPNNDPFYTGRPSEMEAALWFQAIWQQFGYSKGVHLRRIHYQIVSQDPPLQMPNDKGPYENTENCWAYLNNAAKWARYLDLVPGEAFIDRRNPDAIINSRLYPPDSFLYEDPTPRVSVLMSTDEEGNNNWDSYQVPELPQLPSIPLDIPDLPQYWIDGYYGVQQGVLVEVWVEKTTMNDVLEPLCRSFGVNLVTGAGELSITAVLDFMERVREADRPARILYISDFDPAGLGMPISIARKIEYYARKYGSDLDIRLEPIALSVEQADHYNLPRVPVKDSDLRKASFEKAYGKGQVELDALEALRPGELRRITKRAILQYYDMTLEERARQTRRELQDALDQEARYTERLYSEELAELRGLHDHILADYMRTQERFAEIAAQFQAELDTYKDALAQLRERGICVYDDIYDSMDQTVLVDPDDDFPLPEPDLPEEHNEMLYDSNRGYADQLAYYKAQRHNAKQLALEV